MSKEKYFSFNEDVILVEGAQGGLIQDLIKKKIYSIDKNAKTYLKMLLDGKEVAYVLSTMDMGDREYFKEYLNLLTEKEIGSYSEKRYEQRRMYRKLDDGLETVWLELRKSCNLRCCHCYMDCNVEKDKELNILTLEQWKKTISELMVYKPKRIILIGGEPLLFIRIEELIDYIGENFRRAEIVLYSNLTLMNEKLVACLGRNKVKVITSIYSYDDKVHDKITGKVGSLKNIENAIKSLRKNNIYIQANMVIMKYNYDDVIKTEKYIYGITGRKPKFDNVRDIGSSKLNILVPEKHKKENIGRVNFKGISKKEFLKNYSGNSCWQGKLNITCDGYISPCIMGEMFINHKFNVRNESIEYILKEYIKPQFWALSKDEIEVCNECEYRYVCKDCRPICATNQNIKARGKKCRYNPYTRTWI